MLDYIYALSLLSITFTLFYLTKSCLQFKGEIPHQGEGISDRIDKVHGVLDEMMDFVSEMADGFTHQSSQIAQTPPDIFTLLSTFLKPRTPSPVNHAPQEQTNWEILQDYDPKTQETQIEPNQYSNEPISSE